MNRTANFSATLLAFSLSAVLLVSVSSCDAKDVKAKNPTPTSTAVGQAAPTPERLIERSTARWKRVAKAEWIEAYEFITPEQKQAISLNQYIQGKSVHEYGNPRVGQVLKLEKDLGYLRVSALWTPHHPALDKVKLEPGQTLTEDLDMIESWRFVGGDWFYLRAQNEEEFYEQHPDLLKKAPEAAASEKK